MELLVVVENKRVSYFFEVRQSSDRAHEDQGEPLLGVIYSKIELGPAGRQEFRRHTPLQPRLPE